MGIFEKLFRRAKGNGGGEPNTWENENVKFYGCYNYSFRWYLVEMLLDVPAGEIDWEQFQVPEEGVREADWQVPYMEQYLNADGTKKICDVYDEPEADSRPTRIAFFLYKVGAPTLSTPYGDFPLKQAKWLPKRLKSIIEFEAD